MINTKHGLVAILRHVDLAVLPKANRERVMSTNVADIYKIVFQSMEEALAAIDRTPDPEMDAWGELDMKGGE